MEIILRDNKFNYPVIYKFAIANLGFYFIDSLYQSYISLNSPLRI